jgi:hypothetical protein
VSGPQRILVLARGVSMLGNFAAPLALVATAVPQLLFLAVGGPRPIVAIGDCLPLAASPRRVQRRRNPGDARPRGGPGRPYGPDRLGQRGPQRGPGHRDDCRAGPRRAPRDLRRARLGARRQRRQLCTSSGSAQSAPAASEISAARRQRARQPHSAAGRMAYHRSLRLALAADAPRNAVRPAPGRPVPVDQPAAVAPALRSAIALVVSTTAFGVGSAARSHRPRSPLSEPERS